MAVNSSTTNLAHRSEIGSGPASSSASPLALIKRGEADAHAEGALRVSPCEGEVVVRVLTGPHLQPLQLHLTKQVVLRGGACGVCGVWCVVCGVGCGVWGAWCVVRGAWCVVCGA